MCWFKEKQNRLLCIFTHASSCYIVCFSSIAPPTFTEAPPPVLEALVGSQLSLRCGADGNPTPSITWLKDGSVIQGADGKVWYWCCRFPPSSAIISICLLHMYTYTVLWLIFYCLIPAWSIEHSATPQRTATRSSSSRYSIEVLMFIIFY